MKKFAIILALSFLPSVLWGQNFDGDHLHVSAYGRSAHLLNTQHIYENVVDSRDYAIGGLELGFSTSPRDSNYFDRVLNYPRYGIGFSFANMGSLKFKNNSSLGNIYNLYGYAAFDIWKSRFFRFGPKLELGPAYTPKRYDAVNNPGNIYVGTKVFVLVGLGMEMSFLIGKHFEIGANAMIWHHSNGMMGVPNYAFNETGASLFLRYNLDEPYMVQTTRPKERPTHLNGLHWDIYASYGMHSCQAEWHAYNMEHPVGTRTKSKFHAWPRAVLGFDCCYQYHPLFASGLGVDLFYTSNTRMLAECDRILHPDVADQLKYCPVYVGVAAIQEFRYRNFAAHIVLGAYVFQHLGIEEAISWSYQRIGFRVYMPRVGNTFLGFDMKAHHFDRSDCLEFTFGVRI